MMSVDKKPKLCWYCAYLSKCQDLSPCGRFKRYKYGGDFTISHIAQLLGVSERTVYRQIRSKGSKSVCDKLQQITKHRWKYEEQGKVHYFRRQYDD